MIDALYIDEMIRNALKEDMPLGDITTDNTIPENTQTKASLIAKESGIIAGLDVSRRVFEILDSSIAFDAKIKDGQYVEKGQLIAEISGNARAMLKGERTALNFLQRMSGIATKTNAFVEKIRGLHATVVDTRKTTPGLRYIEKYAVKVGGGSNHRFCLSDGVMIKDNHIKAAGGIKQAIEMARKGIPHTIKIEVETETIEQVKEAVDSKADIIMLDNMDNETMKKAVEYIDGRALTEASGNVSMDTIYEIALTGVDIISIGSLTHSVKAFDISMKIL